MGPYQWASQTCSRISSRVRVAPGSLGQQGQQVELLAGQVDLVAVDGDPAGAEVDLHRHRPDGRSGAVAAALGAAGHGPDAGDQLPEAERLDEVVVGAELEAEDPVDLVAPGRDHDDRHVGVGAQAAAHLVAVDVGQPEVEQHHVGRARRRGPRHPVAPARRRSPPARAP